MKWPVYLLLLLLFPFLYKFCEEKTDGFRISRIILSTQEKCTSIPVELPAILNQKFHYLASGGQAWVFISEDEQYVLKFFKTYKRKAKISRDFESCKLAYDKLKEECGLLYLHLDPSSDRLTARIIDKLHIEHQVPLHKTAFLVQKRAVLLYDHINALMRSGNQVEAKQALSAVCQLIRARAQKGIFDEDARIHCNLGFIGHEAILLDTGRLRADPCRKEPNLKKITLKLKTWLEERYPELVPHLESLL